MPISKIGSKALVDCSVAAVDIADNSITAAKLAGSIANAKLANSSVTINSTSVSLGASANVNALDWQSVIVADGSTGTTGVAGRGYFINTTSAAHTFTLPISATRGDTIAIKDYAGTFATFNLTIARNGHKIQGVENNSLISTNRASVVLVYADVTRGWEFVTESNVDVLIPLFIEATGGTISTFGDFKIHSFTGDGSFVVSSLGNPIGSNTVDVLVVSGGGGGGTYGGGGGAGGLILTTCHPIPVSSIPVTVGAGGAGGTSPTAGSNGSNSSFGSAVPLSTLGGGGGASAAPPAAGKSGGSGGGGAGHNVSPVGPGAGTPGQGNRGGTGYGGVPFGSGPFTAGGGGGSGGTGGDAGAPNVAGSGGAGTDVTPTFGPGFGVSGFLAGGGGGGRGGSGGTGGSGGGGTGYVAPTPAPAPAIAALDGIANTGGGGGGRDGQPGNVTSGAGGKGIVIIRYKFQ